MSVETIEQDFKAKVSDRIRLMRNLLVYALYGLTPEEIQIVEGAAK